MIILIPAYQPDENLPSLVEALRQAAPNHPVVVVNDGSSPDFDSVFARSKECGATVVGYPNNHGKGQALKTGFSYIAAHHPGQPVVCADSDGQHSVVDILRVAKAVNAENTVVLGERHFSGRIPLRSSIGNSATRLFFALATGSWLSDTQTGLRGYPAQLLPWLATVRGDRYEYELNVLLEARSRGFGFESVPIATIYLNSNKSSHFRPVRDSARIYAPLLKFSASSFLGFLVDTAAFVALVAVGGPLWLAVLGARAVSAGLNFCVNRTLVFPEGRAVPVRRSAGRYLLLAAGLLGANYVLLLSFTGAGLTPLPAKAVTEAVLFLASFALQRRFLFRNRPAANTAQHSQAQLSTDTDSAQAQTKVWS
ncbi:glycosyltransferase involved in cell wall biosynthesis [Arthrobacter stackebrandtii]|uniref:Glycosyltransferase involved in cell wall biosynthesis n=1 Tax=Arthrobacter stackebrandtii TaxID=272161 RepID=A0ABS4YWJ2_9MICC|nr:bifunctional glycosyltransferase family 2/GtrA family protein [Arthrobacter stackebrandtii]MBP2412850.1 glycosyltransferase involved in cell wall biosynthesis [Arthrobacter stackebrandtii]PYH01332.1 dolichyl-phosphate beta-D-mannosyltransferase [Arthrobacter stackebrandtii]